MNALVPSSHFPLDLLRLPPHSGHHMNAKRPNVIAAAPAISQQIRRYMAANARKGGQAKQQAHPGGYFDSAKGREAALVRWRNRRQEQAHNAGREAVAAEMRRMEAKRVEGERMRVKP